MSFWHSSTKLVSAVLFADPHFQGAMGIAEDKAKLGWLMTSFLLAYGFSSVFLSFWAIFLIPRKCCFGVLHLGFADVLYGLYHQLYRHVDLTCFVGFGRRSIVCTCLYDRKQTYTDHQQARASTMFLLGTPIGAFLGFPITAAVLAHHDWHTTFFVMAGLTVIALLAIVFGLRNLQLKKTIELESTSKRINFKGHIQNTKSLLQNSSFWLVCIFNIALMTYLWGLHSWVPSYLIQTRALILKSLGFIQLPIYCHVTGRSDWCISFRQARTPCYPSL